MVELKIENNVYEMPSSWDEVNMKMFMDIQEINESDAAPAKKMVHMISALSDAPIDVLYLINLEDLSNIDISWMNKEIDKDVKTTITIDGVKYGMVKDMKKLSLGEYVDLDHYTQDLTKNLHYIVAVLMRQVVQEDGDLYIIEKYNSEELEMRAKIFLEKMSVAQLINVSDFFLSSANGFLENMKSFLQSTKM